MVKLLIVGAGGFLGAIARYLISSVVQRLHGGAFPLGTLVVNTLGCLVIGWAVTMVEHLPSVTPHTRIFLTIGVLGAFTTFSTFSHETVELFCCGRSRLALANATGNVLLGAAAVMLGRRLAEIAGF